MKGSNCILVETTRSKLPETKVEVKCETKIVLPALRSDKSLVAIEHGSDRDFVDVKKKVPEVTVSKPAPEEEFDIGSLAD